jgi:hypothetical protein
MAFRAYRGAFLLLTALRFGTKALTPVSPLDVMQVFDRVLGARSMDTLIMLTPRGGVCVGWPVWLTDSRVRGDHRKDSDWDVVIGPDVEGGPIELIVPQATQQAES